MNVNQNRIDEFIQKVNETTLYHNATYSNFLS